MTELMRSVRMALALLASGLPAAQGCFGQTGDWERVKLIQPDRKIHVKLQSGKTLKGNFASWNTDGLTMRQGRDKVTAVAKSDVARIAMPVGKSRGRRAGTAALITAGVVGGIFAIGCAREGCGGEGSEYAIPGLAMLIVLVAGVVALIPQDKEVIYTVAPAAPSRK